MLVTVISNNDDSKIDTIIKYEATFAQISAAKSSSVSYKKVDVSTMKGDTTGAATKLDFEDDAPTIYEGYAKDDYVFVSADLFNDAVVIEKADTISGKTAAVKSDSVRIGDTWYDFAGSFTAETSKEYVAYVYGSYAYYLDGTSGGDVDTLVVKSVGDYKTLDDGVEAKVIFDDGTEKVINITKVDDTDKSTDVTNGGTVKEGEKLAAAIESQTLYAYDEDDGDYELKKVNDSYSDGDNDGHVLAAGSGYNSDKETIDGNDFTDGASVFVIYTNASGSTKYKVIAGSALSGYKTMNNSVATSYVTNDDGDVIAALINLGTSNMKTADTVYGVVTSAYLATNEDGDDVVYLDLITADGVYKEIETEKTDVKDFVKGDIVSYTGDYTKANGDVDVISNTSTDATSSVDTSKGYGAINKYNSSSKLVTFRNAVGTDAYSTSSDTSLIHLTNKLASAKIVSDTQVIYVDMSESTWTAEDGTPTAADEYISTTYSNAYYANAFAVINEDGEFDLLVIEVGDNQILANSGTLTRAKAVFLPK